MDRYEASRLLSAHNVVVDPGDNRSEVEIVEALQRLGAIAMSHNEQSVEEPPTEIISDAI